jgi:hypothetical protein
VQRALDELSDFFKRRGFKTASVAAATGALQHTAATASAAVASAVASAVLRAAPPAMTGFKVLLARLENLTRKQRTAIGVAVVVALLRWRRRDQRPARPGATPQTKATGFSPQSTQELTLPASWLDVTNPPAVLGGQFTGTNPMSSPSQFFRLRKP